VEAATESSLPQDGGAEREEAAAAGVESWAGEFWQAVNIGWTAGAAGADGDGVEAAAGVDVAAGVKVAAACDSPLVRSSTFWGRAGYGSKMNPFFNRAQMV
jgi:hypothetical protein